MKTMVKENVDARDNHKEKLLDELVERAKPFVRASLAEWLEQILEPPAFSAPFTRPLQLSFKDFIKLSDDEQREWRHRVLDLEEKWLVEQLTRRNAEWILIAGGKVVKSSASLHKLPKKKEVYRIARERGFAPFLYIKDLLIEESSAVSSGNSSWSRIAIDDFYPTIEFYLGRPEWHDTKVVSNGNPFIADFDTGCSAVLIDEKEVDENILGSLDFEATGKHLSRRYDYRVCNAKLAVLTKDGKVKAQSFFIRLVHNWRKSSFCSINPARKALVGRELALRLLLNLLLKAEAKETEILK